MDITKQNRNCKQKLDMAKTMKFEVKRVRKYCQKSRNCSLTVADLLSFHDSVSENTQNRTPTALNAKHLQLTPYTKHGYILYIYLILTTKLYIKRHLKTLKNTPIKSVINLTSYKYIFAIF